MNKKNSLDRTLFTAAILGSIILINVIGFRVFGRLDLTRDGLFTLSAATRTTLQNLPDPVTVRAYFSEDMPPPYSSNARYVRDLLEEYYNNADANFSFEFIDPLAEETEEDKEKKKDLKQDIFGRTMREPTSIEKELQAMGIPPVQVRVNDGDKLEVKRAYMGIALLYGDKKETIPVVQDPQGLEYELTTLIRKMTRAEPPKVALIGGHEGPDLQKELSRLTGLLSKTFDLQPLDLTKAETNAIPDDVDAILVVGPKTPFTPDEARAIDAFVMSGRSSAFLLDSMKPKLETMQSEEANHGLGDLLATYGVKIESGVVLDAECATINVSRQQQRGFMRIAQPVKYPFIPVPKTLDPDHPLTRGLSQVAFPFMSPLTLTLDEKAQGVKADILATTSEKSWVQTPPYNLDPFQQWDVVAMGVASAQPIIVSLRGALPSHYTSAAEGEESKEGVNKAADARVLVTGGSTFVGDQFLSAGNEAFVLNLMDWLLLDEALLEVRARGLRSAPIDELSDGARTSLKLFNIAGLPLGLIIFGLLRWRLRERRRATIKL